MRLSKGNDYRWLGLAVMVTSAGGARAKHCFDVLLLMFLLACLLAYLRAFLRRLRYELLSSLSIT